MIRRIHHLAFLACLLTGGCEHESYIDETKHSAKLADAIGDLWSIVPSEGATLKRTQTGPNKWFDIEDRYIPGSWTGSDIFSVSINARPHLSPRAASWLGEHFPDWVEILEVAVESGASDKSAEGTPGKRDSL